MDRSRTVLLVEDHADSSSATEMLLELGGFPVVTAANGEEALRRLRAGLRPAVILLDLMMPKKTGWEFLDEQRADPMLRDIPVVVTSAVNQRPEDTGAKLGLPVDHCLLKPYDLPALMALLTRYCGSGESSSAA
jgi:two-component system, chemotaxis family, chemotaxis protein CheY